MAQRPVVRGNPKIDQDTLQHAGGLSTTAKDFTKRLKSVWKNLDGETVSGVAEKLYEVEAELGTCKAILEKLKRIRIQQSTTLVGGGRRKR